ncbi:MAG: TetR family transcriptional regulator [Dyella sp.]
MGEIAPTAKVSKQTVYAHFANKDALPRAARNEPIRLLRAPPSLISLAAHSLLPCSRGTRSTQA